MEKQYFQKEIETMPVDQLKKLQSEKLVKQVKHVYENLPYYRKLMDEKGREMNLSIRLQREDIFEAMHRV